MHTYIIDYICKYGFDSIQTMTAGPVTLSN